MGPTICIIYIVTIGCYDIDLRNWNQGNWRSSTIEQSKLCGEKDPDGTKGKLRCFGYEF